MKAPTGPWAFATASNCSPRCASDVEGKATRAISAGRSDGVEAATTDGGKLISTTGQPRRDRIAASSALAPLPSSVIKQQCPSGN